MRLDNWQRELRAAGKGPVRLPAVSRGRAWEALVSLTGDFTGAALRGQVRSEPDVAGSPLAAFTVTAGGFDGTKTHFTLALGAASTAGFPEDFDDAAGELPFDLLMTPDGGEEDLLLGGVLPVLGSVTQ